jgi:CDP-glucose 4,6-dehydratase
VEFTLGERLKGLPGPILLTGHTGFKGTWMTYLLESLNLSIVGYSLPAEEGSLFNRAERTGLIPETFADIRDYQALSSFIEIHEPSMIIHMAAQPLVIKSYENSRETFEVNVMGTVNLLDIAFKNNFVKAVLVVTTDKVYKNDNSARSFIESDPLEGKDPYSASKVATEAVVSAWQQIAKTSGGPKVTSVRAGNVIGGGDFAENRIFPDLIRGIINKEVTKIRNPKSTRPWQHVLDPLWGYVLTLAALLEGREISSINFAPVGPSKSVKDLVQIAIQIWDKVQISQESLDDSIQGEMNLESTELHLSSKFAKAQLGWSPTYTQERAIASTVNWWKSLLTLQLGASNLISGEIQEFLKEKK